MNKRDEKAVARLISAYGLKHVLETLAADCRERAMVHEEAKNPERATGWSREARRIQGCSELCGSVGVRKDWPKP